jgi:Na+/H+-dicarboxylate symporter
MHSVNIRKNWLLIGSLVGLAAGLGLGIPAARNDIGPLLATADLLEPIGTLWINALRMIVLPLIVAYIITAVASFTEMKAPFRIGGGAVLTHLVLFLAGMAVMLLVVPPLVDSFDVTPETTEAMRAATVDTAPPPPAPPADFGEVVSRLIPTNLVRAAADEEILPLYVAALLFALAMIRVEEKYRRIIVDFFRAVIATLHVLIGWILLAMPIAVFILIFGMAVRAGAELLSALVWYVLVFSGLLIVIILMLFAVTPVLGGTPLARFARAAAPVQALAAGTRSSMVCLPALVEQARDRLDLPESVVGLVMPLSVSMFKINMCVTGPLRLFFLAHLYGLTFGPAELAGFFMGYVLLSFGTPGIPSGSTFATIPLYIAVGVPLEGVILLRAVDAIPDMFMTAANVTEDLSVATIVSRFAGSSAAAETSAVAVAEARG